MLLYLRYALSFAALLLLTGVAMAFQSAPTEHCPALDASNAKQREALMDYACYLRVAPGEPAYNAGTPEELPDDAQWTSADGNDLVFSHTDAVYWIRLNVRNSGDARQLWYLKLSYPLLDKVAFWHSGIDGTSVTHTGDQYPFMSRGVDYRYFLLPVTLGGSENRAITIRIESSGALNVPLSLETPDAIIAQSNHLTLIHGLFYGALLVFSGFNLLLFFSSGTAYYFYNAFYMASLGLFLFAMGGFANQYFWPDSTAFANTSIPMLISVSSLAMTLFGRSFLEIRPGSRADRILRGLALASLGLFLMTFILPYNKSIVLTTTVALLIIGSLFLVGLIRWRQGYLPAKWYVLAWSGMLAGALIYALAAFGYLADFLAREIFMQVAVGAQVILLNYAMVQRWRLLNQKLLNAEQSARTNLELKVHERTAQLRNTMRELERANRQLATLSLNDALTGLHNRRHLDNLLPELCAESRRSSQPLTIALLDADHFKAVNDKWGHDFGDQCLQHIADILRRHAKRPRDVAIRFGGEEFALLLPGTGADGAGKLCEQILQDLASTSVVTGHGERVQLTMSAGTATLVSGEDQRELFRRADEALYRAKAAGRNRTEQSEPETC
ncbi:sensor domain-containing diguanylate cyclase [Marinobacter orientalis]|uniref:diguanylate cyclase n=1 Tax=Marinobacter orientalis TaxID=1928859 RepID=A0A7Y0RCZ1_9GAMM|nr:diguanylate cyclase [Marinobacter orientalis]NMT63962.1 diguanylate cyclase [Marinobacter orientalis]TGX50058.1 diguanylate cyclase [Marinobacter orientalis]